MNRQERVEFAITTYQRAFRLTDWDIRYAPDGQVGKGNLALTELNAHGRTVTIRLRDDIEGDYIERSVVHELMHLVLYDTSEMVGHTLTKTGSVGLAVLDMYNEQVETICEQVAEAVTGVPWQPHGEKMRRKHLPFTLGVTRFVSDKEDSR